MPDWLIVLIVIVVVVVLLLAIAWWWMHRAAEPVSPAVAKAAPPAPAAVASAASQPYGPGSAAPLADRSAPSGYTIKGNADSMLYHTPESPYYGRTIAEVWFRAAEDAERAGFKRWDRK